MATANTDTPVTPKTGDEAEPYREQLPFLGIEHPYYGFISGSGAGKTFTGVYRLWLNATLWNPDQMGAIIVPDKSQFTDNVKPILEDFNLLDAWDYNSVYTDEPGLITQHGQRILILSADNERQIGRIKGKNLGYVWMDEAAEIPPRAQEIADQRLRVGEYPNLFITTTPDGKNHTYDFFVGDRETTEYAHGRGTIYESDESLAVVGVPSEANPILDDEDIARMRRNLPDSVVAQEIEGEFVEIGSGVFTRDMLTPIKPDRVSNLCSTVIGVDPAVTADAQAAESNDSDYWACAVIQVDRRNARIHVSDMAKRRGMSLQQGVEWIRKVYQAAGEASVVCEANQSQRWLVQALNDAGVGTSPIQSTRNKENKLIDLSVPLESDTITFIDWTDEIADLTDPMDYYSDLISQLIAFPDGSHDDLIDALWLAVDNSNVSLGSIQSFDPFRNDD